MYYMYNIIIHNITIYMYMYIDTIIHIMCAYVCIHMGDRYEGVMQASPMQWT